MESTKDNNYYVNKIKGDLEFIVCHMKEVSMEEFSENELLLDSMLFRMIQIAEYAKRLTETYKLERSDIPWTAMYGFRNRIVHEYGNVDLQIIYDTLKNDIPELLIMI